jgi:heptosyltransferase-2
MQGIMTKQFNCNNLLIRGVNWIGDAVMTMPAIRAIRDNVSDSKISLLVKPWVMELFKDDPNIDELIEYKDTYNSFLGKLGAANDIKKLQFDCAILLQNAIDAALLSFLAGIPERIGYKRDGRGLLLTSGIGVSEDTLKLHHIQYYLHLLDSAGMQSTYRLPFLYPDINARLTSRKRLKDLKRPVIGINPGAAYGSAKRWNVDRFAGVASKIITQLEGSVVIFGSQKEQAIGIEIMNVIPEELISDKTFLNLSGKTSLYELGNLIPECDVILSNDSGPMHMTYATGTPLVALFGSTSPELTGPPNSSFDGAETGYDFSVLSADIECSPCFSRTCKYDHLKCMEMISADDVFNAIKDLLPVKKAVFLDRDGTLCKDAHYLSFLKNLEIYPDIGKIRHLKDNGYLTIGITNQSGIARGFVEEEFVRDVNRLFVEDHGIDDFYYCPHHTDDRCACRKPMPGMLLKARRDHKIDLKSSYYIGDKESDMISASLVGSTPIQIMPGHEEPSAFSTYIGSSLTDCIDRILNTNA